MGSASYGGEEGSDLNERDSFPLLKTSHSLAVSPGLASHELWLLDKSHGRSVPQFPHLHQ